MKQGQERHFGWLDGAGRIQLSPHDPSLEDSIRHSEEQKARGCQQQGPGTENPALPPHML